MISQRSVSHDFRDLKSVIQDVPRLYSILNSIPTQSVGARKQE